jgi:chromosome segregation ATPase
VERDLTDHLVRSRTVELQANKQLKLFSRPGETTEAFLARCAQTADALGDQDTAKLRDKYQAKVASVQAQLLTAQDRAEVLEAQRKGSRNSEILSTAGSILGGLLGGSKSRGGMLGSVLGKAGSAANRRGRTAASGRRVEAAENKIQALHEQLEDLEAELTQEVTDIDSKWAAIAKDTTTLPITLEKSDVKVTQISLAWTPVA